MKIIPFIDLHTDTEDQRIDKIGEAVMRYGKIVGFVTDSDAGKADRYIQKLLDRFPGIQILARCDGPGPGAVSVRVGPPTGHDPRDYE